MLCKTTLLVRYDEVLKFLQLMQVLRLNAIQKAKIAYYNNSIKPVLNRTKLHILRAQSLFYLHLSFDARTSRNAKGDRMNLERSPEGFSISCDIVE